MQAVTPIHALDQIPGTQATRRICEALRGLTDAGGIAILTRRKLAALLSLTERTLTRIVAHLEAFGFLQRLAAGFVFRLAPAPKPATHAAPEVDDPETVAQMLSAFADGCVREGAEPRLPDPSAGPLIAAFVRRLGSKSGALRGADPVQLARLSGESFVRDARTDALAEANFPIHPKWIAPALDAIARGVTLALLAERQRRQAARDARAARTPEPDREATRAGALALLGAL